MKTKALLLSSALLALTLPVLSQTMPGGGGSGGGGGGGTPGGATNTVQYNAGGGTFGGAGPGTTTTLLHGNAAGAPTFSAVDLNADVTGNLGVSHLNSGTGASSTTFWAGDGTWKTPSGSSGANPTATIGATAVNGVATTFMRSDAAPALPATLPALSAANLTNIPMANASGILAGANGGTGNGFFAVSGPATSLKTFTFPNASATILTTNAAVTVAQGGTGLASGTSGGVPYFNSTSTMASSALLTANALVLGGGAGAAPAPMASLGTTTTVLHGNAAGAPTFSAVSLTADVSGILPAANGGAGTVSGILQANGSGTVAATTIGNGLNYTSPTLSLTNTLNAQVGTSYAVASTDAAKIITASNASAQAYTIVQATTAGFTSGFGTTISNIGAGTVTLTATTSTFGNGLTSIVIAPGQVADIGSNGTNYPFTAVSLPVMAQDTLLGNPNASNYPTAMTVPSCANDGAHALAYASHAFACASVTGSYTPASPAYATGNWFWLKEYQNTVGGSAPASGTIYFTPFWQKKAVTLQAIGFDVAALAAGGHCAIAIYANSGSNRPTGTPLASASGLSTASAAFVSGAISVSLSANTIYWAAILCDNTTVQYLAQGALSTIDAYDVGATSMANLSGNSSNILTQWVTTGQTYPTFPTNPTVVESGATASRTPVFFFQAG